MRWVTKSQRADNNNGAPHPVPPIALLMRGMARGTDCPQSKPFQCHANSTRMASLIALDTPMTTDQQLHDALMTTTGLLPVALRAQMKGVGNPYPLLKPRKGHDFTKLPLWPEPTLGFYHEGWCSFEFALGGKYHQRPAHGVGFFCFPNNPACAGKRFIRDIPVLLEDVAKLRPREFEFLSAGESCSVNRFYPVTRYREFPVEEAARDMAWLIQEILPRVRAMLGGTPTTDNVWTKPSSGSPKPPSALSPLPRAATNDTSENQRGRLVAALRKLPPHMRAKLEELKQGQRDLKRPDFLWHFLLQSFATMGNSRGWHGLIGNQQNYERLRFEALEKLAPDARAVRLHQVCRAAGIRIPDKKAEWLAENFERIQQMGGLAEAKERALAAVGTEGKITFLQQFSGIGEKYARNIWMDVYHPDFRDRIAIDERIKSVTAALGLSFVSYAEHEHFYLDIAREAGLEGWELDRLLYNFKDHFVMCLRRGHE